MGDSGEGCLVSLVVAGVIIYVVAIIIAVAAVVAMIVLGLFSIWISKSGSKVLVPQNNLLTALFSSAVWAGTLSLGCMLGSWGLLLALGYTEGEAFTRQLAEHYKFGPNGDLTILFLYDWIVKDSYIFTLNVALVLFIGNRVHLARRSGGWAWLAILPPLFALALSFFIEHADTIIRYVAYLRETDLAKLRDALIAEFAIPFEMLAKTFYAPEEALAWAKASFIRTDGSFFRLATYFPWIFLIVTIGVATRHLFSGADASIEV